PDRDRFHRPYHYKLKARGVLHELVINQSPFKTTGFASTVWDSAIVLSKYLERWPHLVEEKDCVELGAGCGLPEKDFTVFSLNDAHHKLHSHGPQKETVGEENLDFGGTQPTAHEALPQCSKRDRRPAKPILGQFAKEIRDHLDSLFEQSETSDPRNHGKGNTIVGENWGPLRRRRPPTSLVLQRISQEKLWKPLEPSELA
ncbi:hypothetical protein KI387_015081, partial [Taxus chinensis]